LTYFHAKTGEQIEELKNTSRVFCHFVFQVVIALNYCYFSSFLSFLMARWVKSFVGDVLTSYSLILLLCLLALNFTSY
jgi:hypothetical protein